MSEEDADLFWKIDADPEPAQRRESAKPSPRLYRRYPGGGLCLRATRMPEPVTDLNAPAVGVAS